MISSTKDSSLAAGVHPVHYGKNGFSIPTEPAISVTRIVPRHGWQLVDFHELWRYRELLGFLVWRDIKVRYKQAVLGAAWAIIQPLATMAVFTVFLGRVASTSAPSDIPYPLFVLAGLIPWTFFSNAISSAGQSVLANERLVTRTYFPRLLIPFSAASAGLVDFCISASLMIPMMVYYRVIPESTVCRIPVIVFGLCLAAFGVGTWLAALTVAFRDFKHIVPFLTQFWMFATPAIYLQNNLAIGSTGHKLLPFNPAYGLILNFRLALLGKPIDFYSFGISFFVAAAVFVLGIAYFRRVERQFADII